MFPALWHKCLEWLSTASLSLYCILGKPMQNTHDLFVSHNYESMSTSLMQDGHNAVQRQALRDLINFTKLTQTNDWRACADAIDKANIVMFWYAAAWPMCSTWQSPVGFYDFCWGDPVRILWFCAIVEGHALNWTQQLRAIHQLHKVRRVDEGPSLGKDSIFCLQQYSQGSLSE